MKQIFLRRLIVGLTAKNGSGWKRKLKEIEKYKIKKFALFVEEIEKKQRWELYNKLLDLKKRQFVEIPLVHLRHDSELKEIIFLKKNFKTKYFNIHDFCFGDIHKWRGSYKDLYLELGFHNSLDKRAEVNKIGGFCIDLAHFKISKDNRTKEFNYINKRKTVSRYFKCNHLNGCSMDSKKQFHRVRNIKDLEYLKTLPKFIFGKVIALEMYNSIKDQLKYKKFLENYNIKQN